MGLSLGADQTVNVHQELPSAALSRAGFLPTVIIEATGNPESVAEAVNTVAPGGRIVVQGIFAGQKLDGLALDRLVIDEVTVQGALGSPGVWPEVIRLIEARRVNPGLLVTDVLHLDQYSEAIARVKGRQGIKTVVRTAA
jgi:threonine dehydrogenase-like Zn-dependent dehydrogenase